MLFLHTSQLLDRVGISVPALRFLHLVVLPVCAGVVVLEAVASTSIASAAAPALAEEFPAIEGAPMLDGTYFLAALYAVIPIFDLVSKAGSLVVGVADPMRATAKRSWSVFGISSTQAFVWSAAAPQGVRFLLVWTPLLCLGLSPVGNAALNRLISLVVLLAVVLYSAALLQDLMAMRHRSRSRYVTWGGVALRCMFWGGAAAVVTVLLVWLWAGVAAYVSAGSAGSLVPAAPVLAKLSSPIIHGVFFAGGTLVAAALLVVMVLSARMDAPLQRFSQGQTMERAPGGRLSDLLYPVVGELWLRTVYASRYTLLPVSISCALLIGARLLPGATSLAPELVRILCLATGTYAVAGCIANYQFVGIRGNRWRYRFAVERFTTPARLVGRYAVTLYGISAPYMLLAVAVAVASRVSGPPGGAEVPLVALLILLFAPAVAFATSDAAFSNLRQGKGVAESAVGVSTAVLMVGLVMLSFAHQGAAILALIALAALAFIVCTRRLRWFR